MEGETSISKINDKEDDTIDFDFSDGSDIDLKLSLKKRKKIKLPNRRPLKEGEHPESKEQKSGIIYLQTVPPNFTVSRMREEMSKYGEIGRIFLQREKQKSGRKHGRRYVEGWVEFKRKSIAKQVAKYLNAMPVGGKRRSMARETLWTMKYLSGFSFKWYHLNEQLNYEQKLEKMRMHAEISQAKKQASFFAEQVEKGKQLKKLEEKVLKKGGVWDKFQRQIEQRSVIKKKRKSHENQYTGDDLMKMIFAG
ncbi:unnamed protein product [Dracunculus medinensis]|uniref:Activator of basal transcription 1 n=1 Tax=Dracunculus medinensis TaxID=318479 RepID=A0A0N4UFV8_DRAME|nr:unnamed protein product [Dracunculus medinensis]